VPEQTLNIAKLALPIDMFAMHKQALAITAVSQTKLGISFEKFILLLSFFCW
jgi:hypothetical protein